MSDTISFDDYLEAIFMQNGLSTASPESQIQQKEMARIRNLIQQFETDIPFYERE